MVIKFAVNLDNYPIGQISHFEKWPNMAREALFRKTEFYDI